VITNRIGFLILERRRLGAEPVFGTPTLNYYIREFKGLQGWTSGYTGDYGLNQLQWGPTKVLGVHKGDTLEHLGSANYCSLGEGVSYDHRLKATLILPSAYAGVTVDNKILNPRTYFDHNKHPFIDFWTCKPQFAKTGYERLWNRLIEGDLSQAVGGQPSNSYRIPYLPVCCTGPAKTYSVINSDPEKESYPLDVQYSSSIPSPTSNSSYQIFFTVGKQEGAVKTIPEMPIKSGSITTTPWLDDYKLTTLPPGDNTWTYYCKGFTVKYPCPLEIVTGEFSECYRIYNTFTIPVNVYKGSIVKYASYQFLPHPIEVYAITLKECKDSFTGQKKIEIFDGERINTNQLQYLWPSEEKVFCSDCYYDPNSVSLCDICSLGNTANNYWTVDNYYGLDGLAGKTAPCNFSEYSSPPISNTRFFADIADYHTSKLYDPYGYVFGDFLNQYSTNFNDPDLGFKFKCFKDVASLGTVKEEIEGAFSCCKQIHRYRRVIPCPDAFYDDLLYEETYFLGGMCCGAGFSGGYDTEESCDGADIVTGRVDEYRIFSNLGPAPNCDVIIYNEVEERTTKLNGVTTYHFGPVITPFECGTVSGATTSCISTGLPEIGLVPYVEDETVYDYNKYLFYGVSGGTTLPLFDEYLVNTLKDYNTQRGFGNTYAISYTHFIGSDGKKITKYFNYLIKKQLNYSGISFTFQNNSDATTWFIFNPSDLVTYNSNYYKTYSQANEYFRELEKAYLFENITYTGTNGGGLYGFAPYGFDFLKIRNGAPGAPAATGLTMTNLSCDAYIDILQTQGWVCSGSGALKTCTKGITGITFTCAPTCWDNIKSAFGYTFSGSEIKPNNKSIGDTYSWGWTAGFVRTSTVGTASSILDYVSTLDYLNGLTYPCVLNQPYSYGFFRTMRDIYGVTF
jgi:hypothetical protein